jgi:hypothetical protein
VTSVGQNFSTAAVIFASEPSGIVPGFTPTYSPLTFPRATPDPPVQLDRPS